ncbi:MAG: DUF1080 domain-containing protein [Planctomycetaceae bacterium]
MPSLTIACPGCQRRLVFPDHSVVGKTARCPECSERFPIEASVEEGLPEIAVSESPAVVRNRGRKSSESRSGGSGSSRASRRRPAWLPLAITGVLGVVAVVLLLVFSGSGETTSDDMAEGARAGGAADGGRSEVSKKDPAVAIPAASRATGTIRVETTPSGAMLLVDHQRVDDADGEPQLTPCIVTASKGSHAVTIIRRGFQDQTRQVKVSAREADAVFEPAREGTSAVLSTRWFVDPSVGQPLPIESVNAVGRVRDPWLGSEGLSLWFVADGSQGQGVYFATRASPFEEFGVAQFVPITRGRDQRGSPSVTSSGLLVYVVPGTASIWGATRGGPLRPFDDKQPLTSSFKTSPKWTAAQVLGGGLHLYWVETIRDTSTCLHASRPKLDAPFADAESFDLPGTRPCLSADGLRQYVFDGKTLVRWRRVSLRGRFAKDETVAELELPDYVDDPIAGQFAVSDDERWLVYSQSPEVGALMMMVRLHERPNRGSLVVGVPAPARPVVAQADKKKMAGADEPGTPAPKLVIDPKALEKSAKPSTDPAKGAVKAVPELALSVYRSTWHDLLSTRDYKAAAALLVSAGRDTGMAKFQDVLKWDAQELALIEMFWKDARRVVAALKPDDPVRFGSVRLKFVKFENDILVARGQSKPIERPLFKMAASDLVSLVEATLDADDTEAHLRLGVFLYMDLKGRGTSAARRLGRAGAAGSEFLDRRGLRVLAEAMAEIGRGRPERALPLLAKIEATYSKTSAAKKVAAAWNQLYSLEEWTRRGSRRWDVQGVAWRAGLGRSAGSLLLSPRKMAGFELSLEWKTEGETGQGGVFFRYAGSGNLPGDALKLQLSSDAGISADQFSTGALFGVSPPSVNAVKPTGEWNGLKIRVDGDAVRVEINGRRVLMTTVADTELPSSGYVALDGIAGGITYRRVLLVPLSGR